MARRVFFSFHYQRDIWRINPVRNSWVTQDREVAGYWDASLWESTKRQGDAALRRLINDGLNNTSVTAVLIGTETYSRRWVRYEIVKSLERGNGLLGVYVHNIKNQVGMTDQQGPNPFEYLSYTMDQYRRTMSLQEWNGYKWVAYQYVPTISTANIAYRLNLPLSGQVSQAYPVYDWMMGGGYNNFSTWFDQSARAAGR